MSVMKANSILVPKCSPPKVVEQDLRPISRMPDITKVMEGLTLDSLFRHVCDKFDTHQFALARKSTTHALVYFLQVVLEARALNREMMQSNVIRTTEC